MIKCSLSSLQLHAPCGRIICGPGWRRTRENSLRLADAELWLVWKGRGWMRSRDREFTLLPGFCALMRPGGIYDAGHDETQPLGITFIHFDARIGKRTPYEKWPEFFEIDDLNFYDAVTQRIVQLFPVAPDVASILLNGLLQDLLRLPPLRASGSSSPRQTRLHHQQIARLIASVRASTEPVPRVVELARELHLSTAHFSRIFKEATQQNPRDFLIETRLAHARHLLTETSLSIGEIAERLDYADLFFFSRQFKKKTGMSPLQYRRRRDLVFQPADKSSPFTPNENQAAWSEARAMTK